MSTSVSDFFTTSKNYENADDLCYLFSGSSDEYLHNIFVSLPVDKQENIINIGNPLLVDKIIKSLNIDQVIHSRLMCDMWISSNFNPL